MLTCSAATISTPELVLSVRRASVEAASTLVNPVARSDRDRSLLRTQSIEVLRVHQDAASVADWSDVEIALARLCDGDLNREIEFALEEALSGGRVLGCAVTTVRELRAAEADAEMALVDPTHHSAHKHHRHHTAWHRHHNHGSETESSDSDDSGDVGAAVQESERVEDGEDARASDAQAPVVAAGSGGANDGVVGTLRVRSFAIVGRTPDEIAKAERKARYFAKLDRDIYQSAQALALAAKGATRAAFRAGWDAIVVAREAEAAVVALLAAVAEHAALMELAARVVDRARRFAAEAYALSRAADADAAEAWRYEVKEQPSLRELRDELVRLAGGTPKPAAAPPAYGDGEYVDLSASESDDEGHLCPLDSRVLVLRRSGKKEPGFVRFRGLVDHARGTWLGVELDALGAGGNDGMVGDSRYFVCPPGKGLFVRPARVEVLASHAHRSRDFARPASHHGHHHVRRDGSHEGDVGDGGDGGDETQGRATPTGPRPHSAGPSVSMLKGGAEKTTAELFHDAFAAGESLSVSGGGSVGGGSFGGASSEGEGEAGDGEWLAIAERRPKLDMRATQRRAHEREKRLSPVAVVVAWWRGAGEGRDR